MYILSNIIVEHVILYLYNLTIDKKILLINTDISILDIISNI